MEVSGKDLIKILTDRLQEQDKKCYDANIIILLRSLTSNQLNQIITFGGVLDWHNERKLKTP